MTNFVNHHFLVGTFRKGVELAHGALKQNVIFQRVLHFSYLRPIGDTLGEKYDITPQARLLPRETVLYGVAISLYNK